MIKAIILLMLTYIFNIVDYWQTMYAIQHFGLSVELNPVARFLFEHNCGGIVKLIVPAILLIALGLIIKADKKLIWTAYVASIMYLIAIMHNFIVLAQMGIL